MKDLYARLNLSPRASTQGIRSQVSNEEDPQLKRAAREILLRPPRKEIYDRNHRTLQLIGELRQELDLSDAPNWKETGSDDFIDPPGSSRASTSPEDSTSSSTSTESTSAGTTTSKSTGSTTGSTTAQTTQQTASSSSSIVESIVGVFVDAIKGAFGCVVNLIARLAVLAMLFGGVVLVAKMCETIDEATEPDTQVETAESPTQEPDDSESSSQTNSPTQDPAEQSSEQESFSVSPKALPRNGTWWKYTSEELIAPLQISVSEGRHYYVKLTDALTGERVVTVFIRSGRTIEVDMPTGNYDLKYAIGETWYGREHLFGPETEYMKADDTLSFEIVGRQVRGHRVELIVQQGGNLSTDPVPESEF